MTDFQVAEGGRIWQHPLEKPTKPVKYRFNTFTFRTLWSVGITAWIAVGTLPLLLPIEAMAWKSIIGVFWVIFAWLPILTVFLLIEEKRFSKVLGWLLTGVSIMMLALYIMGVSSWESRTGQLSSTPDTSWATTQVQDLTHDPDFEVVHIQGDENDANHFTAMATSPEESILLEIHYTDGEWKAALK